MVVVVVVVGGDPPDVGRPDGVQGQIKRERIKSFEKTKSLSSGRIINRPGGCVINGDVNNEPCLPCPAGLADGVEGEEKLPNEDDGIFFYVMIIICDESGVCVCVCVCVCACMCVCVRAVGYWRRTSTVIITLAIPSGGWQAGYVSMCVGDCPRSMHTQRHTHTILTHTREGPQSPHG